MSSSGSTIPGPKTFCQSSPEMELKPDVFTAPMWFGILKPIPMCAAPLPPPPPHGAIF